MLGRLGENCDLVVVTSRQHVIQDQTLEWIDRHYPGIFQVRRGVAGINNRVHTAHCT